MRFSKVLLTLAILIFMAAFMTSPAYADVQGGISISVNDVTIPGSTSSNDTGGVIMAPAKELANELGGSFTYDSTAMTGTITLAENELVFRLDDGIVKFDGKYINAPMPMKVVNYRFMVPVKFSAETLGFESYMDVKRSTLTVYKPTDGNLVYQVKSGDSLWYISQMFGVSISSVKTQNSLNSDILYIGQRLVIKAYKAAVTAMPAQTSGGATLRTGPGFDRTIAGYLAAQTRVTVTGKTGNWYRVDTPKGNGYIYSSVISMFQDINDTMSNSTYFSGKIAADTSGDSVSHMQYTVQKGDTLWSIAEKSGILYNELLTENNLTAASMLNIGQTLSVPVHSISVKSKLAPGYGEILDWFQQGQYVFPIGASGKLTDLKTGKSFMVQRTMGANHSDTETLTQQDTDIMKEIFGNSWTWDRRPFILETGGRQLAVSVAGMPHAGVDALPYLQNVDGRSDNWGYGPNYDRIKGNGMDGHFDLYFLNSVRHVDNTLDPAHQYLVLTAGGLQ